MFIVWTKRNPSYDRDLHFSPNDFHHLAGIQHADDIDLGLNPRERYGEKFFHAVLSKRITSTKLEKSANWKQIESRLHIINNLDHIIENPLVVAEFRADRVRGGSRINAKYIIKSQTGQDILFLFLDEKTGKYYCKSAFKYEALDYTVNQTQLTTLKITKTTESGYTIIYLRPNFKG